MADYSALYRLAPFDVSAPRMDLYTPLAGIANQITANQDLTMRQKQLQDAEAQRAIENKMAQERLGIAQSELGIRQAAAKRADEPSFEFKTDPIFGGMRVFQTVPGKIPEDVTDKVLQGGPQSVNPYFTGKMNEQQNKDSLYSQRMINAELVLSNPSVEGAALSRVQRGAANVPFVGNSLVSSDYQRYDQAQRDFINATLRRESGAAISQSEFDNANKQYFPQPGDKPEVIQQKALNRRAAIEGFAAGGGPAFRPSHVFDQGGKLIPTQQPAIGGVSGASAKPMKRIKIDVNGNIIP